MGRGIDRSLYFPQLHTTVLGQIKCRDVIVWTVTELFSKIRRLSMAYLIALTRIGMSCRPSRRRSCPLTLGIPGAHGPAIS
jgi:hypothetical protein